MKFDFNFNWNKEQLERQTKLLEMLVGRIETMSVAVDKLKAEVEETKGAVASIIALVEGLAQQIRDLKDDPAALEALANELDQEQAKIAASVAANTEIPTPPTP